MNLTVMEVSGCSKRFAGWSRGTILKMFGKISHLDDVVIIMYKFIR
jgi:hypothetical protein